MCTRVIALLLCLVATAARAEVRADVFSGAGAKVLVVLVDGLVGEFLPGSGPDGEPLMPATGAWCKSALRLTDVLASETHAGLARERLRAGIGALGADGVEWVRIARDGGVDPDGLVRDFLARDGRRVLVLDLDWLEPKLRPDPEVLARLDPAPWEAGLSPTVIEAQRSARQRTATRLAALATRANPRHRTLGRDLRWVVGATHASIDARLAAILEAGRDGGAVVLLTATSSTGLGLREAVGPGTGAGLDVARVPVVLGGAGIEPGTDSGPRQWLRLDAEWFNRGVAGDRYTFAMPAEGSDEQTAVCELRWTTAGFTLIDRTRPRLRPRLHDLALDPGEWLDRAVQFPAIADSLQRELRARLYGERPVIVFRAGEEAVDLRFSSPLPIEVGAGGRSVHLEPGESVRVTMVRGAANLGLGGYVTASIGGVPFLLDELTVHSQAWRKLPDGPVDDPGLTVWME